jgi:Fungal specific transcription factor domain
MTSLLNRHGIHPYLIQTLISTSLFIQALASARLNPTSNLSPKAFSNDLYTLEYSLLSFPSTLPPLCRESAISTSLRFSVLIYLKVVLQEFPHSVNGSSLLVERVKEGLRLIQLGNGENDGLMAWICVVCTAVASGEVREWFVRRLTTMGWHNDRLETGADWLMPLRNVFDEGCVEKIWEEVKMKLSAMNAGSHCQVSTS